MQSDTHVFEVEAPVLQIEVGVLGAVGTRVNGSLASIPGSRARALLVALALRPGRSSSVASLIDDVWSGEPPRSPKNALHTQISRLRAVLPSGMLDSGPAGYRLVVTPDQVDLTRAESIVADARRSLDADAPADAAVAVVAARGLWRGEPAADLPDSDLADGLRRRARAVTIELDSIEIRASIGLGDFESALPLLTRARERDPSDEHVAADLMRCLHALGRTNDALTVFADVRELLAERLGTDPSQALVDLNTELLRPPAAKRSVSIGLRASPNALIGRSDDIEVIEATMARSRVTTILGPGGSGKTRIAHELGLRASSSRPVAFVELASIRRGQDVASAITSTLGLSEADLKIGGLGIARVHTAQERLADALGQAPGLLVLDNCEHLVDDVARVVDELVSASEHLTVLITSRSPLSITAEAVYPLPPLQIDGSGSAAVELFVARARAVRPGVSFDVSEVSRLCRTLDGLPLAIELAAARVRTLTVADINARLTHRFALLRTTDRTRPARHRTLHAVIDWSWTLLAPEQRAALTRLCRFPAGFTADSAERVAGHEGVVDITEALDGLVGQSLLTVVDEGDHVRYHMLETVREFGEEQLTEEAASEVTDRMLDWGVDVARNAQAAYMDGRQMDAVASVEAEHDNLVDILRLALQERRWPDVYTVFAVLAYFWAMRGAHTEVLNWVPRLEGVPTDGEDLLGVDDDCLVIALIVMLAHVGFNDDVRSAARMRIRLRHAVQSRSEVEPGLRFIGTVLTARVDGRGIARALADGTRSAEISVRNAAYMIRASLHENHGRQIEAARDAEAAKTIALDRKDMWSVASAAQALGSIYGQSGRFEEAIANYTQAADLMWEMRAFDESVQTRGFLGAALIAAGRIDEGRAVLTEIADMGSGPDGALSSDAEYEGQRMAAIGAARAEADLADGRIEDGLAHYRRSIEMAQFTGERRVDPYITMLASASVAAHALHGATNDVVTMATVLESAATDRNAPGGFRDLPQLGAVACALGSFLIHSGRDRSRGIGLIALSVKVRARQDFPSMRLELHLDAARHVLGADVVDAELARTAGTTRAGAVAEICELLRP